MIEQACVPQWFVVLARMTRRQVRRGSIRGYGGVPKVMRGIGSPVLDSAPDAQLRPDSVAVLSEAAPSNDSVRPKPADWPAPRQIEVQADVVEAPTALPQLAAAAPTEGHDLVGCVLQLQNYPADEVAQEETESAGRASLPARSVPSREPVDEYADSKPPSMPSPSQPAETVTTVSNPGSVNPVRPHAPELGPVRRGPMSSDEQRPNLRGGAAPALPGRGR